MESDQVESLQKKIEDIESRLSVIEKAILINDIQNESIHVNSKKISLREFINDKAPQTMTDTTLAVAYFVEILAGKNQFDANDIKTGFRESKIPAPTNISDLLAKNAKKGFIMLDDNNKQTGNQQKWVLTNTGENKIKQGFDKEK